ncbi:MAG TPA: sigma-70 family RNA polymerase sigma factor [Ktedonobacteraceae bacterium]|nr:sigma-70 family RNA polymerase sigma factor [Ktedonobacteraceae bacterium]
MMPPNALSHDLPQGQEVLPPFESLYDRYHVQVYRYLYAHLGNEHDAADVMQQVFLQVWKQGQTYDPKRGTVATWILSIAHHRLVDFYRMSQPPLSWESMSEIPTMDQNPEAHVVSEETIAQVRKMLEALPQPEQELLALRFAARLSSAEIASLIGKSEAATKKQLTRLLHRLQEQYRRDVLDELLPDLLEPARPSFVEALLQAHAVPLPISCLHDIREDLLKLVRPVSF